MAVSRRSPIFHFSRIASALPLAPPFRLASPLPLCFRRYHNNYSNQFSSFDEPAIPQRTQQQIKASGNDNPALSIAEVKARLADTEWVLSNNLRAIERRYIFRDFEDAFKYMCLLVQRFKIGPDHFPWFSNWGNRLFVRWTSYDHSCITRTDLRFSRQCDRLYDEKFAKDASKPEDPLKQIPDDLDWADDRQVMYGKDVYYATINHLDLWQWLPQVLQYAQRENAYILWGVSWNRLVWTSLLWDAKTGLPKAMTPADKGRWRTGTPLRRDKGKHFWLSNLADCASQTWMPDSWVEKPENPQKLPLRFSMARSNELLEKEKEKQKQKEKKPSQDENLRPNRPSPRTKNVRIYVD